MNGYVAMKVIKKKQHKKKILIALSVILLLLVGASLFIVIRNQQNDPGKEATRPMNDIDFGPPTNDEKQAGDKKKKEIAGAKNEEKNGSLQGGSQNGPGTITVTITRASQTAQGTPLNIRTYVNGTSDGSCEITLTKDGQPTAHKTSAITFGATSATCGIVDIPASDFTTSGQWHLKIVAKKEGLQNGVAEQGVTIKK